MRGSVSKGIRNNDVYYVGVAVRNPLLDTIRYELQYLYGFVEEMTMNHIANNILLRF